ncbi:MAG TPA: hypothetical protein VF020_07200 [Chthoniobacterales bacterium]
MRTGRSSCEPGTSKIRGKVVELTQRQAALLGYTLRKSSGMRVSQIQKARSHLVRARL